MPLRISSILSEGAPAFFLCIGLLRFREESFLVSRGLAYGLGTLTIVESA